MSSKGISKCHIYSRALKPLIAEYNEIEKILTRLSGMGDDLSIARLLKFNNHHFQIIENILIPLSSSQKNKVKKKFIASPN